MQGIFFSTLIFIANPLSGFKSLYPRVDSLYERQYVGEPERVYTTEILALVKPCIPISFNIGLRPTGFSRTLFGQNTSNDTTIRYRAGGCEYGATCPAPITNNNRDI
mgnify:CR=1 FL=1